MPAPIRILFADDHVLIRAGFQLMFKKNKDIRIAGEARDGEEVIRMAHELKPDVVVMDIGMPVMDGIEATKKLRTELPEIGVIALSVSNQDGQITDMLEAGARGYLLKNADESELSAAIKAVFEGGQYFCADTTPKLARIRAGSKVNIPENDTRPAFTEKELIVIRLICHQFSTKQIAAKLDLSIRTIDWYRVSIFHKMDVKNVAGVVMYAMKHQIV